MRDQKEIQFHQLLDEYQDKLYRVCCGYLYEKKYTDDCFQEVLINIWKSMERFREESKISTYLYRITVNTTITFNTKQKAKWNEKGGVDSFQNTAIKEEEVREDLLHLRKAISELEGEQRLIISMFFEEVSNKEIAEVLGITPNSVGVKIHRIKEKLKNRLS